MLDWLIIDITFLLGALPSGLMGWPYYVICAFFFLICGLFCGYLIWRKGHLQTQDAESEVEKTTSDLEALRKDLQNEESLLRTGQEESEIEKAIEASQK